jgi:hypothetical protein
VCLYLINRRNLNVEYLAICSRTCTKMKTDFYTSILFYFAMDIHQFYSLQIVWLSLSTRNNFSHLRLGFESTRPLLCVSNPKHGHCNLVTYPLQLLCKSKSIRSDLIRLDSNPLESVSKYTPLISAVERHKCLG